ncbi:MAG TPA: HAMP domain-containing sensor histidine kinase [Leptolyngbyaceae cyanobacterium]
MLEAGRPVDNHHFSLTELLAGDGLGFGDWGSVRDSGPLAWDDAGVAGQRSRDNVGAGSTPPNRVQQRLQVEGEWWAGIAALTQLLHANLTSQAAGDPAGLATWEGVLLSGPLPVIWHPTLSQRLSTWVLIPEPLEGLLAVARPLLPGNEKGGGHSSQALQTIPLPPRDPLVAERFCLVLTPTFSLSLVLGQTEQGGLRFQFSFDPEITLQVWNRLRSRIAQIRPPLLNSLDAIANQFPPQAPSYKIVTQFSRLLIEQLRVQPVTSSAPPASNSDAVKLLNLETPITESPLEARWDVPAKPFGLLQGTVEAAADGQTQCSADAELLKAMAHEIRTPLTTIRTFTRSLLKRKDLPEDAVKRLMMIDRECTQQIDRFNLIFRAVELETDGTKQPKSPLSAISLNQIFQNSIPLWQQQAQRRNLTLEVKVPSQMPMVTSDPTMLNQVLTGLIDRFTHSLPPYSHIKLVVSLAGHQLKLQFQSQPKAGGATAETPACQKASVSPFRSVGQLLMFQPETGGLSLNLDATKNLFQALGGKLIVRQKPQRGEVLTVYLPLETRTL